MKRTLLLIPLYLSLAFSLFSQSISVDYINPSNISIYQDMLGNVCTNIFDVEYIGDYIAFGEFTGGSNFMMNDGFVLSSGDVQDAMGPNNSGSTSTNTTGGSDILLNSLVSQTINDAARLNYKFTSDLDLYSVQVSFGSEEYLEWVNSSFNDVFGIFISGPNPSGGIYFNQNIALVPGSVSPINIETINNTSNPALFINNGSGSTPGNEAIEFDGYTTLLSCSIPIIPGEEYSVSIAIGDAGDAAYDSGIFFRYNPNLTPDIQYHFEIQSLYGNGINLFEGYEASLLVVRNPGVSINTPIVADISFGGVATQGLDFNVLSNSVTIPSGQSSFILPLFVYNDFLTETPEELIIYGETGCSANNTQLSLNIYDEYFLDAGFLSDTLIFCGNQNFINTYVNFQDSLLTYLWNTGDTTSNISYFNLSNATETFTVTITHPIGFQVIDTIIIINSSPINNNISNLEDSCNFGSIILTISGGEQPYSYFWDNGETTSNLNMVPSGFYEVTVSDNNGCQTIASTILSSQPPLQNSFNLLSNCIDTIGEVYSTPQYGNPPYQFLWNNGDTDNQLTNIPPGDYFLTITDNFGCQITDSVIGFAPTLFSPVLSYMQTDCDEWEVDITFINGTPPYEIQWSTGVSDSTHLTFTTPGSYYVNVSDAYSCFSHEVFNLLPDSNINFTIQTVITNDNCGPIFNSATVNTIPATGAYTYQWSSFDTTQIVSNLPTGTHSVTVTNSFGCSQTNVVNIYNGQLQATHDVTDITDCINLSNGEISINPIGGVPPYVYLWSNGQTTQSMSNLTQGIYQYELIDGCGNSVWGTAPVGLDLIQTNFIIESVSPLCSLGIGYLSLTETNGYPFSSWIIDSLGNSILPSIPGIFNNLGAGTYLIFTQDTFSCGLDSFYYDLTPTTYSFNINSYPTLCNQATGVINIFESNSLPFNSWLTDSIGNTISPYSQGNFINLNNGEYTIFITDTFLCPIDTIVFNLPYPSTIIDIIPSQNIISCQGDSVLFNAEIQSPTYINEYMIDILPLAMENTSGNELPTLIDDRYYGPYNIGFDFEFFGETQTSFYIGSNGWVSFDPLASATYDPWITAPIPNSDSTRPRNSILAAYRDWHPGISGTITYNTIGTFPNRKLIVSYTDVALFSCTLDHGFFQIILHEGTNIIDVNLIEVPTCLTWSDGMGVSGIQNADGTVAYKLDSLNFTPWEANNYRIRYSPNNILWFDSSNNLIGTGNPIITNVSSPGYYYCEITSCQGQITDSIYIDILNYNPAINLGQDTNMCVGDILEINAGAGYSYLWNNASTFNSIEVSQSGNYSVTVSDINCSIVEDINVLVESFSPIPIYDSTMCNTDTTLITFDNLYNYLWSDGSSSNTIEIYSPGEYYVTMSSANCIYEDTVDLFLTTYPTGLLDDETTICGQSGILNPGIADSFNWSNGYIGPLLYVTQPGLYSVTMSNSSCSTIDSTVVQFGTYPIVNFGQNATICEGESITLDAGNYSNFLWSTGSTSQTISISEENIYWVSVTDINNCSTIDTFILSIIYEVESSFSFDEAFGTVQFYNQSNNAFHYEWNFGDGSATSTETNPIHTYPNQFTNEFYTVSCIAMNVCGSDTAEFELIIFDIEESNSDVELEIYPNPTNGMIFIQSRNNEKYNVSLRNSLGQLLLSKQNLEFTHEIDLVNFSNGIYLLEVRFEDRSLTYKVVKE